MYSLKMSQKAAINTVRFFTKRHDFYNAYEALKGVDEPEYTLLKNSLDKTTDDVDFYRPPPE